MHNLILFIFILIGFTVSGQEIPYRTDYTEYPDYGTVQSLLHGPEILNNVRAFARDNPQYLKETGSIAMNVTCGRIPTSIVSGDNTYKDRTLESLRATVIATAYQFTLLQDPAAEKINSQGFSHTMGQIGNTGTIGTTSRTTDSSVFKQNEVSAQKAIANLLANCLVNQVGLLASNKVETSHRGNLLYVIVYKELTLCDAHPGLFFVPVVIQTGSGPKNLAAANTNCLYLPVMKKGIVLDQIITLRTLYTFPKTSGKNYFYYKTKYDTIHIAITDAGAKDGDTVRVHLNGRVWRKNLAVENSRKIVAVPVRKIEPTRIVITALTKGTISLCQFVVNAMEIHVSSAYAIDVGEQIFIEIEREQ